MPLYYFRCTVCGSGLKTILTPEQAEEKRLCKCGHELERARSAASTSVNEVFDNGLMPRRLERPADAERIYTERATKHTLATKESDHDAS